MAGSVPVAARFGEAIKDGTPAEILSKPRQKYGKSPENGGGTAGGRGAPPASRHNEHMTAEDTNAPTSYLWLWSVRL